MTGAAVLPLRRMAPPDPDELFPLPPGATPRRWQSEAVVALREGLKQWKSVLVSAATGTGKGTLIAGLVVSLARRRRRTLFLVHRDELIDDVMARALKVEPALPLGKVQGRTNEIDAQCVFASVASLGPKRLAQLGPVDVVITDEAHHATAPSYRRVYAHARGQNPLARHIGFTATPFRSAPNGATSGLGAIFEALVYEYDLAQAIADGALAPMECVRVRTSLDLADLDPEDEVRLANLADTPERNQLVVEKYLEHVPGRPAICFCATVDHAKHLADAFRAAGVRAKAVWGEMPARDREETLDLYRSRPDILPVLCNKDLLTEGFDAPRTEAVLLARPTQSRGLFAQMVGRATRLSPGKERGLVIDFVDNTDVHDLATFADLTRPDEREAVPLQPGAKVRHRTDAKLANGTVLEVERGNVPRAKVEWSRDLERWHPIRELVRLVVRAEEEVFRVVPKIAGVTEFTVQLFGEGARAGTVGWYEYRGSKGDRRLTATGGDRAIQLTVQLVEVEGGWEAWRVETSTLPPSPEFPRGSRDVGVELLVERATLERARSEGAEAFRRASIPPRKVDADWQREPATDAQVRALKQWHVRRDLAQISKGEAALLLETKIVKAQIERERKRLGSSL